MQDGLPVYYNGNTISRKISTASQRKRIEQVDEIAPQLIMIPNFPKVFATNQCIWCMNKFEHYQITCQFCHNCQYCGMVAFSQNECQNCGNHTDDAIKHEFEERKTVIF